MSLQRWLQLPLYVSTKRLSKKYFAVVFLYSDISLKRMRRLQRRIRCVVIFCTKTHHDYRLASLQAPEMGGRLFNKGNNWGENMTRTQYDHISEAAAAEWAGTLDDWTRRLMHTQFWQFEYLSLYVHMDTQKHLIWPGCWQAHTLNWAAQGPSRPPPRITETRLNPSNPSIATSVITQSINLGPRSIWQASTWGERQSLSTCRYMILTGWR